MNIYALCGGLIDLTSAILLRRGAGGRMTIP